MPEKVRDDQGNTAMMFAGDEIDRVMVLSNNKSVHIYTKKYGTIVLISGDTEYYPNVVAEINPPEEMDKEDLR